MLHKLRKHMAHRSRHKRLAADPMPTVALEAQHTANGRLLPDRLALLDALPKGAVVAEIGVADGTFSAEILTHAVPARLYLIDAWSQERYAQDEGKVRERLAAEIASGVVTLHHGLSLDVLATLPDGTFDWMYIDTDHSYRLTAAELLACKRLVKPGGRICGHDFCTGNVVTPIRYGVVQAVNEFCLQQGWAYEYLTLESHGHFSFCLRDARAMT